VFVVVDAFDSENIFQQIMMQPPPENGNALQF